MAIFSKVTVTILLAAFSASVGYPLYLDLYYLYDMPRGPDPVTGRVCSMTVNHGFVVYVTQQERARFFFAEDLMFTGGGFTLLAAAVVGKGFRRKREGGSLN